MGKGWHGESERHRLARKGLRKVTRLKRIDKVIDKGLNENIDAMKEAAHRAGRRDLDGVYENMRENQSEPRFVFEEKVEKAPGILARLRREKSASAKRST